ncbi:MAG: tripartite tricarboxylate transporter substrate binding protein [Betaproteobacteria bacterium]|nr:tripartite tricarboxylate transporter substrate binding protein [Betaproteobacteria bacterium]
MITIKRPAPGAALILPCAVFLFHASHCAAQAPAAKYPAQTINVVAASSPGGGIDFFARVVAQKLSDSGMRAIVVNKPGANSIIGFEFVAKSPPDGYTLLMTAGSFVTTPMLYEKVPYDGDRDFTPVIDSGYIPLILVTPPSFPPKTVKELIALAKARPGQVQYGNGGTGSGGNLSAELLKHMTGTDITGIPYKGNAPALTALMGGHVSIMFDTLNTSLQFVQARRLKALAVTSAQRAPQVPEYPTMIESGLPGFEVTAWYMLFAPKKTPRDIVLKLNADLNKSFTDPELVKRMLAQGVTLTGGTPEQAEAHVQAETKRWGPLIKAAGIKGE